MKNWTFLTNHSHVLLCIAQNPQIRLTEIAERVGIRERAASTIVNDLVESGYVTKTRRGRRNEYEVHPHLPLRHPVERDASISKLLEIVEAAGKAGASSQL